MDDEDGVVNLESPAVALPLEKRDVVSELHRRETRRRAYLDVSWQMPQLCPFPQIRRHARHQLPNLLVNPHQSLIAMLTRLGDAVEEPPNARSNLQREQELGDDGGFPRGPSEVVAARKV